MILGTLLNIIWKKEKMITGEFDYSISNMKIMDSNQITYNYNFKQLSSLHSNSIKIPFGYNYGHVYALWLGCAIQKLFET